MCSKQWKPSLYVTDIATWSCDVGAEKTVYLILISCKIRFCIPFYSILRNRFIDVLSFLFLCEGTQTGNQIFQGEFDSMSSNDTLHYLFQPLDVRLRKDSNCSKLKGPVGTNVFPLVFEQRLCHFQLFHWICLNGICFHCSRSGRYGSRALWDSRDHSPAHSRPRSYSPPKSPQSTHREGSHTNRPYRRPHPTHYRPQYRNYAGM